MHMGVSPWYGYVPTESNSADIPSRWWDGAPEHVPAFLGRYVRMMFPTEDEFRFWSRH